MKKKLFLFISSLMFLSCSKNEDTKTEEKKVKGYVIDAVTMDSIPNAGLILRSNSRRNSNQLWNFDQELAFSTSDKDGFFSIDFSCHETTLYGLETTVEGYWKQYNMTIPSFNCYNVDRRIDIYLTPLSYIKVRINNQNSPSASTDSIHFNGGLDQSQEYTSYQSNRYSHIFGLRGMVDTVFIATIKAGEDLLHYWDIYQNGQMTRNAQYVNCNPFDTCLISIQY